MTSIKLNYIYSILYQILSIVVPIFTIPYVSRIFGAEGLGIYSYTCSIAQYFTLFAMLGLNNYGVRAIAEVRDNKEKLNNVFSEIFCMQLLISTIVLVLYCVFVFLCKDTYRFYFIILSIQVVSALFDVNWYFWGVEKFKITVVRNSIIKLLSLVAIFTLIKSEDDLWIYLLIHVLSIFLTSVVLWPNLLKTVRIIKPTWKSVIKHIKPNLVLFIPVVAISVYKYMDKIMLGNFSIEEAGYYENVEKILTVALGIVTALGTVMLPRMSNLVAHNDLKQAYSYISKSMEFVIFISFGLTCGMIAVAPSFVPLYFGPGFERSIVVMQTLSITAIITSWANVIRTQFLIPFKKDRVYVYSVILGAVVNFIFNVFFIPIYGAMGAVFGTIAAEFSVAFVQTIAVKRELHSRSMLLNSIPYLIAGIFMVLSVRFIDSMVKGMLLTFVTDVLVGMIVYAAIIIVFKFKSIKNVFERFKISH